MRKIVLFAAAGILWATLPAAALAKGGGGSKGAQHSDLTITKKTDQSSPKVMNAKGKGTFKPNSQRYDPYKTYKFR